MRSSFVSVVCVCLAFGGVSALIVPNEIPTLLSIIYSNIPVLKKGTDSRVGWGFRLGDRADFQVLVELGPQTNTQPLANQNEGGGAGKRNVLNNLGNTLYAQRQKEKDQISESEGGKFLDQWRKKLSSLPEVEVPESTDGPTRIELGVGEVDAKEVIPDDTAIMLERLHGRKVVTTTTLKPKTTTSYKDALDNVDLD